MFVLRRGVVDFMHPYKKGLHARYLALMTPGSRAPGVSVFLGSVEKGLLFLASGST